MDNPQVNDDIKDRVDVCILSKQFQDMNIAVYGTHEKPLFKAKDIGELLGIKDVLSTMKDFNEIEKGVGYYATPGGMQNMTMLTTRGLYRLLFNSRKEIAKQFRNWVFDVIEEIRLTGEYNLKKKMELENMQIKEKTLLQSYDKKKVLYLGTVDEDLIKFGITSDIKERTKSNKRDFGEVFMVQEVIECEQHKELESKLKEHNDITNRRVSKVFNGKNQTELIRVDDHLQMQDVYGIVTNIRKTLYIDKEILVMQHDEIIEKEKTRQMELQLELKREEYKYLLEIKKLELSQPQQISQTAQNNEKKKVEKSKKPDDLDVYLQYIDDRTIYSEQNADYITMTVLYQNFMQWVRETLDKFPVPSQTIFSGKVRQHKEITIRQTRINGIKTVVVSNRKFK